MKNLLSIVSICVPSIIAIFIYSCERKDSCSTWVVPPPSSFAFQIKENGARLPDNILSQIKCYYFQGSIKKYINLHYSNADLAEYIAGQGFLIDEVDMIYASGNNSIRDFYFKFPDGTVDTLYLEIQKVETCQAKKEKCQCNYPIRSIKYNHHEVSEHELSWTYEAPLYVFER